jgi:hypothetical protein
MKCSARVFKHHSSHSDLPPHPSFHRRLPPIEKTLHNIPSSGAHPWRIFLISFMDSSLRSIDPFALCGHTHRYISQGSKIKYGTLLRKTHCSVAYKPARTLSPVEIGLGAIEKDEGNESDKTPSLKYPFGLLLAHRLRSPRTIYV